eukprot:gene11002-11156_t
MPHGKGGLPTLSQEAKKLKTIIEHELPVTEDAGREMAKLIKSCSLPELSALGLSPPPLAALNSAALTAGSCIKPMAERLQTDLISSLQYNHQNCYLYNVNKQRPLAAILATAASILKDPLPIKCIEAVFLGILLTQGWDDLQRMPVGFKSQGPDGKVYRHIVLVVCQVPTRLFGAIGLSRRPELMYKPLQFASLADIMADYQSGYRHWGHELIKVRVGLPVEHRLDLLHLPVCWRYITISPTKRSWQCTAALLNQHADAAESLQSQYRALASTTPTCRPHISLMYAALPRSMKVQYDEIQSLVMASVPSLDLLDCTYQQSKQELSKVSTAAGYLCHIQLECDLDVRPQVLFDIFCHPDNSKAFRDIKRGGYRKVKLDEPGFKSVELEQRGELSIMWNSWVIRTYLDVVEDSRDPDCLKIAFTLLRSDILSQFQGSWELRHRKNEAGDVVGCHAQLKQDVLPKGIPSFVARLPMLGGLLRRVVLQMAHRGVEDILNIVDKYAAAKGCKTVDEVLEEIALERGEVIHRESQGREGTAPGTADRADAGMISGDGATCCEGSESDSVGSCCSSADSVVSNVLMPPAAEPEYASASGSKGGFAAAAVGPVWP